MNKKLAIIGASYLQDPLIKKAKNMGVETHVFAWKTDDVGERSADFFYPISIIEKEEILKKCEEIGIDGICSIASDLATNTVNYVAYHMQLVGNSITCTEKSTNKYLMRQAFTLNGDPSPKSILVESEADLDGMALDYPIIVKPIDRSGSRGITKLSSSQGLAEAIDYAKSQGFVKKVLVEEFVEGIEYSVECLTYNGKHTFLAITQKYTTGAPNFIEIGHMQPAIISNDMLIKVKEVVFHALSSLGIENSASHSELKITPEGTIKIIEIGGRMGGDFIGSDLVQLSTGIDFVQAVIEVALGKEPDLSHDKKGKIALVKFVCDKEDYKTIEKIRANIPSQIIYDDASNNIVTQVTDSSSRYGACVFTLDYVNDVEKYMFNRME